MLEVADLAARYGRATVLEGVGFAVGAGEVVALLGRNGAGKSTTLKAVMGLVRPTGGSVRVSDVEVAGWEPYRIARAGVGYVPEERRIFADLTVLENLSVGRRVGKWGVERVFGLFPALADMRDRVGAQMSGGEQQMLTIGRTLMGDPLVLLLDEPSEGLAPVVVRQIQDAVVGLQGDGVAVVLAEQNLAFAAPIAARAVVLERGRVAWSGWMQDLVADGAALGRSLAA